MKEGKVWKEYDNKNTRRVKTMHAKCNHCKDQDRHEFLAENSKMISFRCNKCGLTNMIVKYQ